jgi:hypothetical protein
MRRVPEKGRTLMRPGLSAARLPTACVAVLLTLASCATVPQRPSSEWLGVLPADATMYVSLSVTGSADLIKKALKTAGPGLQDVNTLLDMTKRLVCSLTLAKGTPARFAGVALGGYPGGLIGRRLSGNKEWTRTAGPAGPHWEWTKPGIQMSIPNNGILLASNGDIDSLLARWAAPPPLVLPPEVASDMERTDLVLYMPELPGGLQQNAAQNGVHVPLNEVWMNAVKVKGGYNVSGTANTSSGQEAELLTLILKLGLVGWMRSENLPDTAEKLKAVSVSASGSQVKLAGLHFSDDEMFPFLLSLLKGMAPPSDAPEPEPSP